MADVKLRPDLLARATAAKNELAPTFVAPDADSVWIIRHNGLIGFGPDGRAEQGEIYYAGEFYAAGLDLERLIKLGAIEEPSTAELRQYEQLVKAASEPDNPPALVADTNVQSQIQELKDQLAQMMEVIQSQSAIISGAQVLGSPESAAPAPAGDSTPPPTPAPVPTGNPADTNDPESQAANTTGNSNVPPATPAAGEPGNV